MDRGGDHDRPAHDRDAFRSRVRPTQAPEERSVHPRLQVSRISRREARCSTAVVTAETAQRVLDGLRERFIVCLWEPDSVVGMPSRAVDVAWHEFILITRAYTDFCRRAFGRYLHHHPESVMAVPMEDALDRTIEVLRSAFPGRVGASILLTIDRDLGIVGTEAGDGSLARLAPPRGGGCGGSGGGYSGGADGGGGHGCGGGCSSGGH